MDILTRSQKIFIMLLNMGLIILSTVGIFTNNFLPYNLVIQDENMGGIRISELAGTLSRFEDALLDRNLILSCNDKYYEYNLREVGVTTNKEEIEQEVLNIYNAGFLNVIKNYIGIYNNSKSLNLKYKVQRDIFFSKLKNLENIELRQPQDAEFKYIDGRVEIIEGINGLEFDIERLIFLIEEECVSDEHIMLMMPFREVLPEVSSQELKAKGVNELIAYFTTQFNPDLVNRTSNLRIAVEAINGTVLPPGEVFSFNEIVGARTIEKGYKTSPIYIGNQISSGVGGGICQVSSTLYNAVLLADLEVVERANHSLTVPYVPLSRDATVSWNSVDFKFRNSTDAHIYIHAEIGKNDLTVELHGTSTGKKIVLKSERISTILPKTSYIYDESLEKGKEIVVTQGQPGYTSRLIKETYVDDELVDRVIVSTDKYFPTTTIIKMSRL
ncbi:MAG: VanW family protein [Bacillota bacterium]